MIQDGQVRRLKKVLSRGMSSGVAALKSGMREKTTRKHRRESKMPSDGNRHHPLFEAARQRTANNLAWRIPPSAAATHARRPGMSGGPPSVAPDHRKTHHRENTPPPQVGNPPLRGGWRDSGA